VQQLVGADIEWSKESSMEHMRGGILPAVMQRTGNGRKSQRGISRRKHEVRLPIVAVIPTIKGQAGNDGAAGKTETLKEV
jgi:hypothetical protein